MSVVEVLGLLVLAASLSAVSYVLVEERVRHARTLVTKPSWALGLGGVLTAVSLAIAVSVSWIGPLHAGRPAEALTPGQLATGIPAPAYVPSNLTPTLRGATQDNPALYAQGCHVDFAATEPKPGCVFVDGNDGPRVALLGDSHAAQWFPALEAAVAEAGGSLLSLTKSACPSYDVAVVNDALEREYRECDQWRTAAIEEAQSWGADLVVLGNFGSGYESRILGDEDFVEQWAAGVSSTIQQFGQTPVVVLGDTPRWPTPVNVCVSGALDDPSSCAKPRAELTRPDIASAEAAAASAAGATYVDTASWLCGEMCEPIAGHALVYRDESHMTATFAALLAPLIGRELGL